MKNPNLLTVAVSSSALFDLSESDAIYQAEGLEAYRRYQIEHEDEILDPGGRPLRVPLPLAAGRRLADDDATRERRPERAPRPSLEGLLRSAGEGARPAVD